MKKIKFFMSSGTVGSDREEIVEVDDDTTPEELEEYASDWAHNYFEFGYEEVEEDDE